MKLPPDEQRRYTKIAPSCFVKPHGEGTFTFASGEKYVGQWKDGEPKK